MQLQNQVALVTGASRGIGRAVALELARQGARVVGTATSEAGAAAITEYLAQIAQQLDLPPGKGAVLNVNDVSACNELVAEVQKDFGGLAILVNNAGITLDQLAARMKEDEWDQVISTNLNAVARMSRAVLRNMMRAKYGRIINITSVVASSGNPGQINYAAAKAGVEGMSRALAMEIGSRNITVNCIAPGFIDTDMTKALSEQQVAALMQRIPMARFGAPEDIGAACAFLASSQAGYITGTTLHVNGGMYMA